MSVAFFDATRAAAVEEGELVEAFRRVLRSGQYILGHEVAAFEAAMRHRLGVERAIGVSSGTDALLVSLMGLGVGPGDQVVVPAYGFVATPEAVLRVGATPVFADVEPGSLLIDVESARSCLTASTKAIVAVHLFGAVADVDALAGLGPPVIEDAAQAFGATLRERQVGALGAAACFSFFPTKNLGGFGDGGLFTTNDAALADRVARLRSHGLANLGGYVEVGGNFRLDALHAALLRVRLRRVDAALSRRREVACAYRRELASRGLLARFAPLEVPAGASANQFVIRVSARDRLRAELAHQGIETKVYYRVALPDEPCFDALPTLSPPAIEARRAAESTLALPCYPELTDAEICRVVDGLQAAESAG